MLTAGVWFPVLPPSCKRAHLIKIFSLPRRSPSGLQAASATFLTNRRICFWSLCGARAEGCRVHRRCAVLLCTPAPGALLEQNYNFDSRMRWCTTGGINRCSKKKKIISWPHGGSPTTAALYFLWRVLYCFCSSLCFVGERITEAAD